jgi:hypothetical protein
MFSKKLMALSAVCLFIFCASPVLGMGGNFLASYIGRYEGPAFSTLNHESTVLAQNDKTAIEDDEKSKSESETKESTAADGDEKKASKAESKPLKPFVPSEKIPGEQAVDFPVDI